MADSPSMYGYANNFGASPDAFAPSPSARERSNDRYNSHDSASQHHNDYMYGNDRYDDEEPPFDPRDSYESRPVPYDLSLPDDFSPPSPGGPPPPPPAHRSRNGSQHVSPTPAIASHNSYGFPGQSPSNQYDTPPHEMHRHSMPVYSQSNSYQPYTSPVNQDQNRRSANGADYNRAPPRHHSYDSRYNGSSGSMQPTVEDAPPTPAPGNHTRDRAGGPRSGQYDDRRYDQVPSPAPLNLSGRASASSGIYSASTAPTTQYSPGYGYSPVSFRDQSNLSQTSYNTIPSQQQRISDDVVGRSPSPVDGYVGGYGLPPVPPTLVAGMDPSIAQEISDRIYAEKQANYHNNGGNSPQGRFDQQPYQPSRPHPLPYQEAAQPFVPAASTYDDRQSRIATATVPIVKPRAISPDPRLPVRKSVSPAPPSPDKRRLSGVPFGPDSYNAFNPSLTGSTSNPSLSARYETREPDPDAKIITHDGREVDPSDHIPESNYAPLLETKGPKYASQQPDRNYRPPPSNRQPPNPASGRTPLRQAAPRPHPTAASSPIQMSGGLSDPSTPQNGRNRLQKKVNRMSAQPAPRSSPLAPVSPYQDNAYAPSPRSLPRQYAEEFSNENYAPQQHGSPGHPGSVGPPPIPAKIPVSPHAQSPHPNSPDAWALLEEMKNIDLGSGRARRKGGR